MSILSTSDEECLGVNAEIVETLPWSETVETLP